MTTCLQKDASPSNISWSIKIISQNRENLLWQIDHVTGWILSANLYLPPDILLILLISCNRREIKEFSFVRFSEKQDAFRKKHTYGHLCVKREWPLIITYFLYFDIMHYHFYRVMRIIDMLKLKNWHYLNYKIRPYLFFQQKTNTVFGHLIYGRFWKFHYRASSDTVESQSCLRMWAD